MSLESEIKRLADVAEKLLMLMLDREQESQGVDTLTADAAEPETSDTKPETPAATSKKTAKKTAGKKRASKKTASKKNTKSSKASKKGDADLLDYSDLDAMKQEMADYADASGVPESLKELKAFVKNKGYAMVSEVPADERVGFMAEFTAHFDNLVNGI